MDNETANGERWKQNSCTLHQTLHNMKHKKDMTWHRLFWIYFNVAFPSTREFRADSTALDGNLKRFFTWYVDALLFFLWQTIKRIANLMFLFSSHFPGVSAPLQISGNYIEQYQFDFLLRFDSYKVTTAINSGGNAGNKLESSRKPKRRHQHYSILRDRTNGNWSS